MTISILTATTRTGGYVGCGCGKSREQRQAEQAARKERLAQIAQAKAEGKVGPNAPGYFSKPKTA